jgi:hypothetical protein
MSKGKNSPSKDKHVSTEFKAYGDKIASNKNEIHYLPLIANSSQS